ncbi:MAG: alkaline phosphatase family protein [Acidimicrobiales bacterium]
MNTTAEDLMLPMYGGACISNVIPAVMGMLAGRDTLERADSGSNAEQRSAFAGIIPAYGYGAAGTAGTASHDDGDIPAWVPSCLIEARQVVVLVVDGLGWLQMQRYESPDVLREMEGGWITSVAPTTTAAALTSITTGLPPSVHGVVGYRMRVHQDNDIDDVLNALRWKTEFGGDARSLVRPREFQPVAPFGDRSVPVLARADLCGTGFTAAHLYGARHVSWNVPSSIPVEVERLLKSGESLVYVYYDGVDRVAHAHGLGDHYLAELSYADDLIAGILDVLPEGAALAVTADHGQVQMDGPAIEIDPSVLEMVGLISGEGRFRWLHCRDGAMADLLEAAEYIYGDVAWVRSRSQIIDEAWMGPGTSPAVAERLGDVALVAREPVAFMDPADVGESRLKGRHGSLTREEMMVPFVAYLSE